jgi:hypothetical protein
MSNIYLDVGNIEIRIRSRFCKILYLSSMGVSTPSRAGDNSDAIGADALGALEPIKIIEATPKLPYARTEIQRSLPQPSTQRRHDSLKEIAVNPHSSLDAASPRTLFYLAYGSNLCAETFQGKRCIRPVSQLNVLVPELALTFDLAGLPYVEPCFANTRYRSQKSSEADTEKTSLLPLRSRRYHKTRWEKGLVGVVYEVTREDFARIISSEGGGSSYTTILVDCYELPLGEETVPVQPTSQPFKAHTLLSLSYPESSDAPIGARRSRPDPNYAQPSKRYLKLITDGADEHHLPLEYKAFLHQIRPYVATTRSQKIGGILFKAVWFPIIGPLFALVGSLADKRGGGPAWLRHLLSVTFRASWASYDLIFKRMFGDGERTIGDDVADGDK